MRNTLFAKASLLLLFALISLSPVQAFYRHHPKPVNAVNRSLAFIPSIEVETFKPIFDPTSIKQPNPEITEYMRHLLNQSRVLPVQTPGQAQLQITCSDSLCLHLTAGVYTQKGAPPIWTYRQNTLWFIDVPKSPKTMAKNIVRQLESDYTAAKSNP